VRKAKGSDRHREKAALAMSNDEANAYLEDFRTRAETLTDSASLQELEDEFNTMFEPRLFPPDRVKAYEILARAATRLDLEAAGAASE
jgi:hypothetical protein